MRVQGFLSTEFPEAHFLPQPVGLVERAILGLRPSFLDEVALLVVLELLKVDEELETTQGLDVDVLSGIDSCGLVLAVLIVILVLQQTSQVVGF